MGALLRCIPDNSFQSWALKCWESMQKKCRMWEITKDKGLVSSTNKLQGENGGRRAGKTYRLRELNGHIATVMWELICTLIQIYNSWEFSGSPVVKNWCFHCHGLSSIAGQGTKISQAAWHDQIYISNNLTRKNSFLIPLKKCEQ